MSLKTKERILSTALFLFNTKGLHEVSTRQITVYLGISQGHLTYYFKKRSEILEALYHQYENQILVLLKELIGDSYSFKRWVKSILKIQYEYRFLFLDFAQVLRESQDIKNKYYELRVLRKQIISNFLLILNIEYSDLRIENIVLLLEFGMMYDVMEKQSKEIILQNTYENILKNIKIKKAR